MVQKHYDDPSNQIITSALVMLSDVKSYTTHGSSSELRRFDLTPDKSLLNKVPFYQANN